MRKLILLVAVTLYSLSVHAADEYLIGVWGTFTLTPEGTVVDVEYESRPPTSLERFVERSISAWRFEPVVEDGQAVSIRVRFGFYLIGTPDGNDVIVNIGEVNYSEVLPLTATGDNRPPVYPESALTNGNQATVVVRFRTGPDGRVTDFHIARVGIVDGEHLRQRHRNLLVRDFSATTSRAVRRWRFQPPPNGESGTGQISIQFRMEQQWATGDGSGLSHVWYRMGPAPWELEDDAQVAHDAPTGGEYDLGDSRIRRLPDVAPGS